jgi:hypothetical protein
MEAPVLPDGVVAVRVNGHWKVRLGTREPPRWLPVYYYQPHIDNRTKAERNLEQAEDQAEQERQWTEEGLSQLAAQREEEREERMMYQEQSDRDLEASLNSRWWAMHDHATAAWAAQNVQVPADMPAPAGHVPMSFSPAGKD